MRIVSSLTALALATSLWGATPVASWPTNIHDFGAFDEDMGKVDAHFTVRNIGDAPLLITGARASCGCTAPVYPTAPIASGDSAIVTVTYDPAGRPGKFTKKVKIDTNGKPSQSVLTISGVVIGTDHTLRAHYPIDAGTLKLRSRTVPFGDIYKGRVKTAFLEVYNQSTDTIVPTIEGLPAYITAQVSPASIPPGEQASISLFFNTAECAEWGLVSSEPTINGTPVDVTAVLYEDFSRLTEKQRDDAPKIAVSTNAINLGNQLKRSITHHTITVENYGRSPLIIRRISSSTPESVNATLSRAEIKPGAKATIKVDVDTRAVADPNMINSRITLITNDPSRPVANVRVVGELPKP